MDIPMQQYLLFQRLKEKFLRGLTTEISGNCGLSIFPVTDKNREHLDELYKIYNIKINWRDICEYRKILDKVEPAINIASLVGHNSARAAVCGYQKRKITGSELAEIKNLIYSQLKNGAVGISTGLLYLPGIFSDSIEITEILTITAKFAKVHATHLRNEGDTLIESIFEAISNTKNARAPKLHISHFKTAGQTNWHKLDEALKIISENSNKKLQITADRYPYTESMTNLSAYLPKPFREMDDVTIKKFVTDTNTKNQALQNLQSLSHEFWSAFRLVSSSLEKFSPYLGWKFAKIAESLNIPCAQICLELLSDSPSAIAACSGMSEDNMRRIISLPYVCCGSDESCKNQDYKFGRSHPRGFGSFPRFINVAREKMPLEEIIHKITALPAKIFNIKERGLIKENFYADLVLFDPDKLKDNANFEKPHKICDGIIKVWVNGTLTWDHGQSTGKRAGKFLVT